MEAAAYRHDTDDHTASATRHPDPTRARRAAARVLLAAVLAGAGCSDGAPERAEAKPVTARPAVHSGAPIEPAAPRPVAPLPAGTTCTSSDCHASLTTARFVHGVLRDDNCSICHEEDRGDHVYPVKRPGNQACTFCHESVTGQRIHRHGATEVACLSCHDPHASEHRSLLRAGSTATLCGSCHPPESHAHPHGPNANGECVACHEPHESDFAGLLRGGEGAEHCYSCHDATRDVMVNSKRLHGPAAMDCLICHQPHASDHAHALKKPIKDTCFSCHADVEKSVAGAEHPHGAVSTLEQCANCHDPHASDRPFLLKGRQDALCLQCHNKAIEAYDGRTIPDMSASIRGRRFLHGPVESGRCSACHNVHGSTQSKLLRQRFTPSFYASFDLKNYALCFECHEDELVTAERTTELTDFRDGDLNLHYVHVHRQQKGRTCRACHEMHGSDLPAHVAESVPFEGSGWALPIGFRKTSTGGSCAPGCHEPMNYSRVEILPSPGGDQ